MTKVMTLGFILTSKEILLGMKKRGFGAEKWNGFGGKVQEGETIEQALNREFEEECKIKIKKSKKIGEIEFEFPKKPETLKVHVFKILEYEGEPIETEEMKPQWFKIHKIPYESMWSDDIHWMPLFLKEKKFRGKILFDEKEQVLKSIINETNELE
jgi:8-oxo-dGTP diphosphatase/2-hydroxy-dATP diphosphatase